MYRKDYLQRQFEEFGRVLAEILGFKKIQDWDQYQKALEAAFNKFSRQDLKKLESFSLNDFEQEIVNREDLSLDEKKMTAELLFEKMNFYQEQDQAEQYENLKQKCKSLYEFLAANKTEHEFDLGIHYRLEYLKK